MTRAKTESPIAPAPIDPAKINPRAASPALASVRAQMEAHPEVPVPEDAQLNDALPPVTPLRRFDTHRLLPAKYGSNYESVLTRIADNDEHLQLIFELDNATNARLEAEENLRPSITPRELVFNVPHYRIINAAFTHPNPLGARFSTPERGAWYAAFELATAKAEIIFHKSVEFAEVNWSEREVLQYDEYLADFTGSFHDLRPESTPEGKQSLPRLLPRSSQLHRVAKAGRRVNEPRLARSHLPQRAPSRRHVHRMFPAQRRVECPEGQPFSSDVDSKPCCFQ